MSISISAEAGETPELLNLLQKIFETIHLRKEKHQAEEKLRESEERFGAIFETAEDAIFMKDREHRYVLINPTGERLFGLPASKVNGRTDQEIFCGNAALSLRALKEADARVISGETVEDEFSLQVSGIPITFRVFLPRIDQEASETSESFDPLAAGHECILFVDDERDLVKIGQQMLSQSGYNVVARTSAIEALETFRTQREKIDLVITDQTMPNMTGDVLAGQVMSMRPDIPIIICSVCSEKMNQGGARAMGIRHFIMKPLVMKKLAETIRSVLGRH